MKPSGGSDETTGMVPTVLTSRGRWQHGRIDRGQGPWTETAIELIKSNRTTFRGHRNPYALRMRSSDPVHETETMGTA